MKKSDYDGRRCWYCYEPIELVRGLWRDYDLEEERATEVVHRCHQAGTFPARVRRASRLREWLREAPWKAFAARSLTPDEIAVAFGNPKEIYGNNDTTEQSVAAH